MQILYGVLIRFCLTEFAKIGTVSTPFLSVKWVVFERISIVGVIVVDEAA